VLSDAGNELGKWDEGPDASPSPCSDDGAVAAAYGAATRPGSRAADGHRRPRRKIVWMAEGDEAFKPAAITAAFRAVAR
jgi:hypothetical protein